MKNVELRLISELMKDGRKSDRELAKVIGVSQPTVTRIRTRLEKEGVIKEYTMIPDFSKLGFELMSIIMYKLKPLPSDELESLHEAARELDKEEHRPYLMIMDGKGLGYDLVVVSYHRTYSDYSEYMRDIRSGKGLRAKAYMNLSEVQGFLIDLKYEKHYQPITFSKVAAHIQSKINEENNGT